MSNKISNALPPIGGMTGATGLLFETFSPVNSIIWTIILATIGAIVGAVVGYLMKLFLDKLFKKA